MREIHRLHNLHCLIQMQEYTFSMQKNLIQNVNSENFYVNLCPVFNNKVNNVYKSSFILQKHSSYFAFLNQLSLKVEDMILLSEGILKGAQIIKFKYSTCWKSGLIQGQSWETPEGGSTFKPPGLSLSNFRCFKQAFSGDWNIVNSEPETHRQDEEQLLYYESPNCILTHPESTVCFSIVMGGYNAWKQGQYLFQIFLSP